MCLGQIRRTATLLLFAALACEVQSQTTTSGALAGTVVDQSNAVVSDAVLEHVRSSLHMRDETIRVLKRGGAFFFTTNNRFSVLPEPHVRIIGFGLLPRKVMEPVAKLVRRTPYRTRLHSRRELRRIFDGTGNVLLPSFEAGELGPRHERVRKLWDRLRGIPGVPAILGPFVPQYFITGEKR